MVPTAIEGDYTLHGSVLLLQGSLELEHKLMARDHLVTIMNGRAVDYRVGHLALLVDRVLGDEPPNCDMLMPLLWSWSR